MPSSRHSWPITTRASPNRPQTARTCTGRYARTINLEDAFAWKEERTLSRALTLQYDKVVFVLAPTDQAKAAIGKRVTVLDYPDGRLSIRYKGIELAYRTFDKLRQVSQAEIVENKRLGAVLAFIREQQIARAEPRSKKAPRRRDQSDARLFKVG